jgi:hypothetical protein
MSFDFADYIFLLHFTLEPAESAFQRLVITEFNFCHLLNHLPFEKRGRMFHSVKDRWDRMRPTAMAKRTPTLTFSRARCQAFPKML